MIPDLKWLENPDASVLATERMAGFAMKGEYGWDGWLGSYFCNMPEQGVTILSMQNTTDCGTSPTVRKVRNAVLAVLSTTVYKPDELKQYTNLPCLAAVPDVQRKRRKTGAAAPLLLSRMEQGGPFCEAFRLLRLKLLRRLQPPRSPAGSPLPLR